MYQSNQLGQGSGSSYERKEPVDQDKAKQRVITWLADAYAMESEGAKTLEQHAKAAEGYTEVQTKLRQHAEETRQHAQKIKACLERLGSQPSAAKEAVGTVMGTVRGVATFAAKDVVVKNVLADYASEHFEIACYKSLIAAAEEANDGETAQVCRDILGEEEAMVEFLDAQVAPVTVQFLAKQSAAKQPGESEGGPEGDTQSPGASRGEASGQQGLLESAKQNGPAVAGGLVVAAGTGLLIARALTQASGGDKNKQQGLEGQTSSAEYKTTRNAYDSDDADYSTKFSAKPDSEQRPYSEQVGERGSLSAQPFGSSDLRGEVKAEEQATASVQGTTQVSESELFQANPQGETVLEYAEAHSAPRNPSVSEINTHLKQYKQVDGSDIEVVMGASGRVTLKGTVESEDTKRLAKETLKDDLNIGEVHNHLKVQA